MCGEFIWILTTAFTIKVQSAFHKHHQIAEEVSPSAAVNWIQKSKCMSIVVESNGRLLEEGIRSVVVPEFDQ